MLLSILQAGLTCRWAPVEEPWWQAAQAFPECVIPSAACVLCRRRAVLVL